MGIAKRSQSKRQGRSVGHAGHSQAVSRLTPIPGASHSLAFPRYWTNRLR